MTEAAERQVFDMRHTWYDVTLAQQIIAADPRPAFPIALAPLRTWLSLSMVVVDVAHARTVDLAEPLILAAEDDGNLPIDGWHRIYRALEEGDTHLLAYPLTLAETHRIRHQSRH